MKEDPRLEDWVQSKVREDIYLQNPKNIFSIFYAQTHTFVFHTYIQTMQTNTPNTNPAHTTRNYVHMKESMRHIFFHAPFLTQSAKPKQTNANQWIKNFWTWHVWISSSPLLVWSQQCYPPSPCPITHSHVGHDSFVRATWPIHVWDMTLTSLWRASLMCDATSSFVRHASFIGVTWFIHTWDMMYSFEGLALEWTTE